MKKLLDLSSWRTALGNLLPSAHGHQGGSRKAAIGSMLIMAFAVVGCGDDSSSSTGPNDDDQLVESSSSVEKGSSSSEKAKSSSSKEEKETKESSSSVKSESSSEDSVSSSSFLNDNSSSSIASTEESSSSVASESSSSEEFDWSVPKEAYLNPNIDYGTMTDERDGKVYRTVKIGDQTWMAENLNYADSVNTPSLKGRSLCYNDESKNCEVAGRLYTWAAAIDSVNLYKEYSIDCGDGKTCTLPDTVYGICPSGWHLPNTAEWETLLVAVGGELFLTYEDKYTSGKTLKSATGWFTNELDGENGNGTDSVGFSALPAGTAFIGAYYINFSYVGEAAFFWSSSEFNTDETIYMSLSNLLRLAKLEHLFNKHYGMSVRCLKN
ncbi:MAG: fibrobacter succinogenes major paralogous domain-containing protein [Fibrobacter sp.]|nr:fibrobacter succinogenes major paralogous domain-containing protein [Fibrobacter sp.]